MTLKRKEDSNVHFATVRVKDRLVTLAMVLTVDLQLSIGYSICNPSDTFDRNLAERISTGRALKESSRIPFQKIKATQYLRSEVVLDFLFDEALREFVENPTGYIPALARF